MAPRKSNANGEEKAKPVTTVASSRVTRSMDRRTRSETQQNGAKVTGSVAKLESPKKTKRKKTAIETGKAKKVKKEEVEVEKVEEEEETEVEDSTKLKIVIEHCKQCNAFKTRAIQVKEGLEGAVPGVMVTLNPEKPRRGCFEIREDGGETFISLLEMKRPFAPMKALDMEEVIEDIIKKVK
ncbi:hypothetical protein AALP_AA7G172600 [Arabis alpina]|uniref:Uncharacterized protein n=1 Tax=Arabis alpina TaxID=50452 RepID=A0A087GIN9_ARAAL|nr:hypothetical protein AALP_AA7G172600 [Arabis alpina]